jgi:glyoxylase-like metal-dependent hydrolase (beta-lactamase superfamily II)
MDAAIIRAGVVGRRVFHNRGLFHMSSEPGAREVVYIVWVIEAGGHITLVDTGFSAGVAAQRGIEAHVPTAEILSRLGCHPDDIESVIVSHLHFDHFGEPNLFGRATFYIQRSEVEYFLGRGRSHPVYRFADEDSIACLPRLIKASRVNLLDGGVTNLGPVTTMHVGGHTPGSQLAIARCQTSTVVLACDAAHTYDNLTRRTPAAAFHNYDECQTAFDTIASLARGGRWYPGHDRSICDTLRPIGDAVYELAP